MRRRLVVSLRTPTMIVMSCIADGRQPNMGSELFMLFSPVVAPPIVIMAAIVHLLAHKYLAYRYWWQWVSAGVAYSGVLLELVSPWLLLLVAIFAPLIVYASEDASGRALASKNPVQEIDLSPYWR